VARISVVVNGRSYAVTCDDGEEQHVLQLAAEVDRRVGQLVAGIGQVGQERLLLLASLLLTDELTDKPRHRTDGVADEPTSVAADDVVGEELRTLARRIETMAQRLQSAPPEIAPVPRSR
jgi:cell division protein ZapA